MSLDSETATAFTPPPAEADVSTGSVPDSTPATDFGKPFYSVCRLSGGRGFFWVAWRSFDDACERRVLNSGTTTDRQAAEMQAAQATGNGQRWADGFAADCRRWLHAQQKAGRLAATTTTTTTAASVELVYSWYDAVDGQGEGGYTAHRVVKKTTRRVYVDRENYRPDREPRDGATAYYYLRTFTLDRAALERDGEAWAPGKWGKLFYIRPEPRVASAAPCLVTLGLGRTATTADVQRAYRRLARTMHPDAGGDDQAFIKLQNAYEHALRLVGTDAA